MRKLKLIILTVAVSALTANAQSLVEVLEAHSAVMGFDALRNVKSMVVKGSNQMGDRGSMPFSLYLIKPDKSRMESEMMGRKMLTVRNGEKGWVTDFRNGGIREIGGGENARGRGQSSAGATRGSRAGAGRQGMGRGGAGQAGLSLGGALFNWEKKQLDVKLEGTEVYEGTSVYKLQSVDTVGNVTHSFIDVDSYVLLKETTTRKFQDREIKSSRVFSNYEMIDDIAVAFNIENKRDSGGQNSAGQGRGGRGFGGSATQVIESVQFNVEIDETLFEKPGN